MYSGSIESTIPLRDVENEIANLSEEVVLVGVPIGAVAIWYVRISINHSHALEVRAGKKRGGIVRVADHLSHVEHEDGGADDILPRWEVHHCWCRSGRVTVREIGQTTASITV